VNLAEAPSCDSCGVTSALIPLPDGHAANAARDSSLEEADDEPTLRQKLAVIAALNATPTAWTGPEVVPDLRERRSCKGRWSPSGTEVLLPMASRRQAHPGRHFAYLRIEGRRSWSSHPCPGHRPRGWLRHHIEDVEEDPCRQGLASIRGDCCMIW
jgi:hypothetical protein